MAFRRMISPKIFLCLLLLPLQVFAQGYYYDSIEDIQLKKSIIRALINEVNPDYLITVESDIWSRASYYRDVEPFDRILDIMDESSGFRGVNNPIVFDGDKIEVLTGRRISDIPGTSVMVYDNKTQYDPAHDYSMYEVLDGDEIWVKSGKPFDQIGEEVVIVYDCLFPPVFNCGKKPRKSAFQGASFDRRNTESSKRFQYDRFVKIEERDEHNKDLVLDTDFGSEASATEFDELRSAAEQKNNEISLRSQEPAWWTSFKSGSPPQKIFWSLLLLMILRVFWLIVRRNAVGK